MAGQEPAFLTTRGASRRGPRTTRGLPRTPGTPSFLVQRSGHGHVLCQTPGDATPTHPGDSASTPPAPQERPRPPGPRRRPPLSPLHPAAVRSQHPSPRAATVTRTVSGLLPALARGPEPTSHLQMFAQWFLKEAASHLLGWWGAQLPWGAGHGPASLELPGKPVL